MQKERRIDEFGHANGQTQRDTLGSKGLHEVGRVVEAQEGSAEEAKVLTTLSVNTNDEGMDGTVVEGHDAVLGAKPGGEGLLVGNVGHTEHHHVEGVGGGCVKMEHLRHGLMS